MDKHPALAALILGSLAKKGMAKHAPEADGGDEEPMEHDHEQLKSIAKDLIAAIHSEDVDAVADLLCEACECCDACPHVEGPHVEEGDGDAY